MDPRLNLALKLIGLVAVIAIAYGVISATTSIGDDSSPGDQAIVPTATPAASSSATTGVEATARPSPDTPVSSGPLPTATPPPSAPAQPSAPTVTPTAVPPVTAPSQPPTPAPGRQVVPAPIDGVDIIVRESFPPQYVVHINAGLPSGCAQKAGHDMTRSGNTFRIRVWNSMPTGAVACTQIYGMYELDVDLGSGPQSGQQYTVEVNDQRRTFTAQ